MVSINYPDGGIMYAAIQAPASTGDLFKLAVDDVEKIASVSPLPLTMIITGNSPLADLVVELLEWSSFMTILH